MIDEIKSLDRNKWEKNTLKYILEEFKDLTNFEGLLNKIFNDLNFEKYILDWQQDSNTLLAVQIKPNSYESTLLLEISVFNNYFRVLRAIRDENNNIIDYESGVKEEKKLEEKIVEYFEKNNFIYISPKLQNITAENLDNNFYNNKPLGYILFGYQ